MNYKISMWLSAQILSVKFKTVLYISGFYKSIVVFVLIDFVVWILLSCLMPVDKPWHIVYAVDK